MRRADPLTWAKGKVVPLVRRRPREVIVAGPSVRGGNHLYQWMLASILRDGNPEAFVLHVPNQEPWLEEFPALRSLSLPEEQLRWTDKRLLRLGQGFGSDFTREDLTRFCQGYLLSSERFRSRLQRLSYLGDASTVVVNVRCGDYYGTRFEPEFGMRIVPYVQAALDKQRALGPLERLQFVSDDLPWCESAFNGRLEGFQVSFERPGQGAFDDLAALAAAKRLILANSTFSYWGAYLATTLGTAPVWVVAPHFHQRSFNDMAPWLHDTRWNKINTLPGGWSLI